MQAGRVFAAILFWSGASIALGFTLALADEGWAVLTRRDPTISIIVASRIAASPRLSVAIIFVVGVVIGALIAHFASWVA